MRHRLDRVRHDERGAVLMIVAICLLVVLGMLVLTVDLGRGVAFKRELVNGADAAALAAAQQCALQRGSAAATAAGADVLAKNVDLSGLDAKYKMPGCNSQDASSSQRYVEVTATADIDYLFAGLLGFDSGDVAAHAVAIYGPVPSTNPIPITVDQQQLLTQCGIVADAPPPDRIEDCDLDYPKDALQEPRWGVLDLANWGEEFAAPCSVDSNTLKNIISGGGWSGGDLSAPAYDCLDNGLAFTVWQTMAGRILVFPVLDITRSTGTVKPNRAPLGGQDCTGAQIADLRAAGFDCQIDTAYIVGWIRLLVNDVVNKGSTVQVQTTYLGLTTGGGVPCVPGDPCPVTDFGIRAVRLVG